MVRRRPRVPARRGGASRCRRVGAQLAGDGGLLGQLAQLLAGVGAAQNQVDAAGAQVAADQLDELDGQVPRPGVRPSRHSLARIGRQTGRCAINGSQTSTPTTSQLLAQATRCRPGASGSWCQAAPKSLRPHRRMRVSAHEGVVTHQPHRRADGDQQGKDQVEQDQVEQDQADQRALAKKRCGRAWCQACCRRAPQSMPQTVCSPGWAPNPRAQPAEGAEGRGGEAAAEAVQQAGDQGR